MYVCIKNINTNIDKVNQICWLTWVWAGHKRCSLVQGSGQWPADSDHCSHCSPGLITTCTILTLSCPKPKLFRTMI